jgi:hypothetical protein
MPGPGRGRRTGRKGRRGRRGRRRGTWAGGDLLWQKWPGGSVHCGVRGGTGMHTPFVEIGAAARLEASYRIWPRD